MVIKPKSKYIKRNCSRLVYEWQMFFKGSLYMNKPLNTSPDDSRRLRDRSLCYKHMPWAERRRSPEERPRRALMEEFIFGMESETMANTFHKHRWEKGSSSDSVGFPWENPPPARVEHFGSYSRHSSVTQLTGGWPSQKRKWSSQLCGCSCTPCTRHNPADAAAWAVSSSAWGGGGRENKTITLSV